MKTIRFALASLALVALVACQTMTPKTFNERLAAGYVTVTSVRQTATTLLNSRKISSSDALNIQEQANTARSGLDIARDVYALRPKEGEDKLVVTLRVLDAMTRYLEAKQKETK